MTTSDPAAAGTEGPPARRPAAGATSDPAGGAGRRAPGRSSSTRPDVSATDGAMPCTREEALDLLGATAPRWRGWRWVLRFLGAYVAAQVVVRLVVGDLGGAVANLAGGGVLLLLALGGGYLLARSAVARARDADVTPGTVREVERVAGAAGLWVDLDDGTGATWRAVPHPGLVAGARVWCTPVRDQALVRLVVRDDAGAPAIAEPETAAAVGWDPHWRERLEDRS